MDQPSSNARLRFGFDQLPPQLREAARWVIDHPDDIALLSTHEQARRAGVTVATMTRLAQRLGMPGYEDVRKLFADAVRHRPDSYSGHAEQMLARRDREGDPALVQDIFASLAHHLQDLSSPEIVARFSAAADLVARADATIQVHTETPSFFHTMTPAFAAVEGLAAMVAARRGPEGLTALAASEQQLDSSNTYLQPRAKGRRRK